MRPKDIGTAAETAVVNHLRATGHFPTAERLTLKGGADQGDIGHCGEFIFEIKGGKQAAKDGPLRIQSWLFEATVEARNRGVQWGILVTQRAGFGVKRVDNWWAYMNAADLAAALGSPHAVKYVDDLMPVKMELGDLLYVLEGAGHTFA